MPDINDLEKEMWTFKEKCKLYAAQAEKHHKEIREAVNDRICSLLKDARLDYERGEKLIQFNGYTISETYIRNDKECIKIEAATAEEHIRLVAEFIKEHLDRLKIERTKREQEEIIQKRYNNMVLEIAKQLPSQLLGQTFVRDNILKIADILVEAKNEKISIFSETYLGLTMHELKKTFEGTNATNEAASFLILEIEKLQPWNLKAS